MPRISMQRKKLSKADIIANPSRLKWQVDTSTWSIAKKQEEFDKCKADPAYWMYNYGVISHPTRGKIQFKLFPFQADLVRTMFNSKNVVILKSRQLGISTLLAAFCCWLSIFYESKDTLIIATKGETAKGFIEKVKVFYQFTPSWMKPRTLSWNAYSLRLSNGSRLRASTTTEDAGRSDALSLLVVDEAAFIENLKKIWTAAAPTISTGGKAILLSTPNGPSGFFYDTCKLAAEYQDALNDGRMTKIEEKTSFKLVKLTWDLHPERDQAWFDNMCKTLNYDKHDIAQELECSFEGSGDTVIPFNVIEWLKRDVRRTKVDDDIFINEIEANIIAPYIEEVFTSYNVENIYDRESMKSTITEALIEGLGIYKTKKEVSTEEYENIVAGIDISTGGSKDFSTFVAFDTKNKINVCTLQCKLDMRLFAITSYLLGKYYNDAMLVVERNIGYDFLLRLEQDLGYYNIYTADDKKSGFLTNAKTRPQLISILKGMLSNPAESQRPVINDSRILTEIENFIWAKGKRAQAAENKNDDLVIATAICFKGINDEVGLEPIGFLFNKKEEPQSEGELRDFLTRTFDIVKERDDRTEDESTIWDKINSDGSSLLEQQIAYWEMFGIPYGPELKKK